MAETSPCIRPKPPVMAGQNKIGTRLEGSATLVISPIWPIKVWLCASEVAPYATFSLLDRVTTEWVIGEAEVSCPVSAEFRPVVECTCPGWKDTRSVRHDGGAPCYSVRQQLMSL